MAQADVDYAEVFRTFPSPALLLTPDLRVADANEAFLRVSGRGLDELLGRCVFEAFPDNPGDPGADGGRRLRASLERVLATGCRDTMAMQKYDVEVPDRPGVYEERYWSPVNTPVLGADGRVTVVVHRVEEVTALVRAHRALQGRPGQMLSIEEQMEADLLTRSQELQSLNEQLREANARERAVAISLQRAMLPTVPSGHRAVVAVRYQPATGSLNVCGDWYDLADLDSHRVAVAVGDVVGHGLEAAGVMGQLRSALSAAIRATGGPAEALRTLALYALTVEGALATTVVQLVIDREARTITYSCAGHPPPLLVGPDGVVDALGNATDPPLGFWETEIRRSAAVIDYRPGSTLVMYTDGLIERRGEDIDAGLERLARSLARHRALAPEALADALLADLRTSAEQTLDDTALVAVRLA
ncbi:PP2C family protein-serine/threonine phosphatase [Streptacidiphilus griseoplanus]|uniref:PP2C family protein-serine/threonine phosphatase n=1 Tax=Peterkaempfera griseoplana TaxID=66896 RepID=UPI0006E13F4B|nr:SpoIIE family protein phosphatase [Peterkaempfera griseoplana]